MLEIPETGRRCRVGNVEIGFGRPLTVIAGPCLLESEDLALAVGQRMKAVCQSLGLQYIFKASFDKANRSSIRSPRGPGLEKGMEQLAAIGAEIGCPTTTDIHLPEQAEPVAEVVDLVQIPAFLSRQTDLLLAAGECATKFGRAVSVKKGQFMSPSEMAGPVRKLAEAGCDNVLLIDRGTFFGYHRLVNDFAGLGDLMELSSTPAGGGFDMQGPAPVCLDVTHSCQSPGADGGTGETTGGNRERAPLLARAGVAVGAPCLFLEVHPNPDKAMSDAATQVTPDVAERILEQCAAIHGAI